MLFSPNFNRKSNQKKTSFAFPPLSICPETNNDSQKNWTYLTNQVCDYFTGSYKSLSWFLLFSPSSLILAQAPKVQNTCKTWDGSCSSSVGLQLDRGSVQRSFTAPDRTGIRIYYSPPAVRRMEQRRRSADAVEPQQVKVGSIDPPENWETRQPSLACSSSYEQWLSSLSRQHRELLESRSGYLTGPVPTVAGSASSSADGMPPSAAFHSLEIGEISANLSDDMKEMTNCVRQAIRSSSLERKSTKESGSQVDA